MPENTGQWPKKTRRTPRTCACPEATCLIKDLTQLLHWWLIDQTLRPEIQPTSTTRVILWSVSFVETKKPACSNIRHSELQFSWVTYNCCCFVGNVCPSRLGFRSCNLWINHLARNTPPPPHTHIQKRTKNTKCDIFALSRSEINGEVLQLRRQLLSLAPSNAT